MAKFTNYTDFLKGGPNWDILKELAHKTLVTPKAHSNILLLLLYIKNNNILL